MINPLNVLNKTSLDYQIDWYHNNYKSLEEMQSKDSSMYERYLSMGSGFSLGSLMLNNS